MGCLEPGWKNDPSADWHSPGFAQTDNDPVVCVSYDDAQAYLAWFSKKRGHTYRLPTEAEWEHAARAGTTTAFWWGTDDSAECRYANAADKTFSQRFPEDAANQNCADGYVFTAPVGSFQPHPWRLYDMNGNAWQMMADCWNENYEGAPADGSPSTSGDCTKRVVRGGSWNSFPANLRVASRNRTISPRDSRVTFRLARTLP
jgi:formylglycine-generating enzyme required for sulfatase activity